MSTILPLDHAKDIRQCYHAMPKYEFSLILKGSHELTEEIADQLFVAGCNDGTPGACGREFSAISNVKSAGYEVERVEIEAGAMPQSA